MNTISKPLWPLSSSFSTKSCHLPSSILTPGRKFQPFSFIYCSTSWWGSMITCCEGGEGSAWKSRSICIRVGWMHGLWHVLNAHNSEAEPYVQNPKIVSISNRIIDKLYRLRHYGCLPAHHHTDILPIDIDTTNVLTKLVFCITQFWR